MIQDENLTEGNWTLKDLQVDQNRGVVLSMLILLENVQKKVHNATGCIQNRDNLDGTVLGPAYNYQVKRNRLTGKKEATYEAPHRNKTCLAIFPTAEFWGNYVLICGDTEQLRRIRTRKVTIPTAIPYTGTAPDEYEVTMMALAVPNTSYRSPKTKK